VAGYRDIPTPLPEGETGKVKPFTPRESIEDAMRTIMDCIRGHITGKA